MYSIDELNAKNVAQLKDIAKEIGAKIKSNDNKKRLFTPFSTPRPSSPSRMLQLPRERE